MNELANQDPNELYFQAQHLICNGQYENCRIILKNLVDVLKNRRDCFIWKRYYLNAAHLYTHVLDYLGRYDEEQDVFNDLLIFTPTDIYLGDYAVFLHRRKKNFKLAEKYYIQSLTLYPFQATIHLRYATFLRYIRNDLVSSEKYYKLATEIQPNAETLGNYASFLHSNGNIDQAESLYQTSIELDNCHVNNYCNYGLLLSEERKRYEAAEDCYKKAMNLSDEKHTNTLYNYAVMLDTHCNRKVEAETLYRKAIQIDANHAYSLYNLAVLLETKELCLKRQRKAMDSKLEILNLKEINQEIYNLYQQAMTADSKDAVIASDCGRYAYLRCNDLDLAEKALTHALSLDPSSEVALYYLSLLLQKRMRYSNAESMINRLLVLNPKHTQGILLWARIQTDLMTSRGITSTDAINESDIANLANILKAYESVLGLLKEPRIALNEYIQVAQNFGNDKQKLQTLEIQKTFS